jgi:tetratricopeptide (TPR) repeat protein
LSGAEGREVGRNLDENMRGQLLFAQKFYREAAVDLGSRVGFDNSFLAAASYFLSGRYDKAVNDFERINIPPNKDPNEFLLWEIAAKQELLRQDPRAKVSAEIPAEFGLPANLKNYPVNIATALQLPLIEAALADGKTDFAELVRNNISSKSTARNLEYAQYLHAKILAAQGSKEESIEVLEKLLAKTDNREIRALATYTKIVTALEIEKITKEEALAQLDKVRIIWRGDAAEFNTLEKIGELYADSKDYPEALLAYKTALSAIPFHPRSDQITAKMRKIYKTAMQKDFDNPEKSFDALALYYDYVELKPTGREGEYLTIELAERLVAFDLIQEGIDVLVNFVGNIKDAEEKSLINTRIAVLYYYMRQPEKALAQLELSEAEGTPKYIEWQRKILFVRILSEQEKYDEALTKINRLPPQRSSELRAEIYWSKQDWQNFIDNFNAMESKTEQNIMKAAIAYAMLSEDKALMEFQKQNSAAMEKSKYAEAFKFITQKNSIDYNDLGTSLKLDFAKQVIDNYKKDLKLTDFFGKEVAGVEVEKAASIEQ